MVGIDEVGRGAWAGPLLVCAVRLHKNLRGLKDSKLLTRVERERLAIKIANHADVGFGWASSLEIDRLGLTAASCLACRRAIEELTLGENEEIIIDGIVNYLPIGYNVTLMVKADQKVPAVSAASIIAKVTRDNLMRELAVNHRHYGFDRHVGYGTPEHIDAINKHGLCIHHRKSYNLRSVQLELL